jgi:hypothetical protein
VEFCVEFEGATSWLFVEENLPPARILPVNTKSHFRLQIFPEGGTGRGESPPPPSKPPRLQAAAAASQRLGFASLFFHVSCHGIVVQTEQITFTYILKNFDEDEVRLNYIFE